jgi:hypothetical protein
VRTSELDGVVQAIGSFFKRWKSRGGEKQLLSRYESTEQDAKKEKRCQQFFAKTVCGFSFSAGKEQNLGTFTSNKRSDTRNSGWNPSFC